MAEFGRESTTDDVLAGRDLTGKRVLVTGVSAGLGVETVRALWAHGAEVIGTARDLAKAQKALGEVSEKLSAELKLLELDLASLDSVRACADELLREGKPLALIIANAGIMATPYERTVDGFESQIGVNHLGHFLLINRLVPLIPEGGRVVSLSSVAHQLSDIDLDDLNYQQREYDPGLAYGASKTAVVLFTVELDRRLKQRGARAVVVHPGNIRTELMRHVTPEILTRMTEILMAGTDRVPGDVRLKSVQQGAATSVWAATVTAELVGGRYCEDCHVADVAAKGMAGVRPYAVDPERARLLWIKSEEMVGESFE